MIAIQCAAAGLGGALGSMARWGVSRVCVALPWLPAPAGTLIVNVVGCALIGAAMGWFGSRDRSPDPNLFALLVPGFLGGLTTFSAFGHETFDLLRNGRPGSAVAVVALNLGLGIGAVALGWTMARSFSGHTGP